MIKSKLIITLIKNEHGYTFSKTTSNFFIHSNITRKGLSKYTIDQLKFYMDNLIVRSQQYFCKNLIAEYPDKKQALTDFIHFYLEKHDRLKATSAPQSQIYSYHVLAHWINIFTLC
jgi:cysteinyl-tRNA synthetase